MSDCRARLVTQEPPSTPHLYVPEPRPKQGHWTSEQLVRRCDSKARLADSVGHLSGTCCVGEWRPKPFQLQHEWLLRQLFRKMHVWPVLPHCWAYKVVSSISTYTLCSMRFQRLHGRDAAQGQLREAMLGPHCRSWASTRFSSVAEPCLSKTTTRGSERLSASLTSFLQVRHSFRLRAHKELLSLEYDRDDCPRVAEFNAQGDPGPIRSESALAQKNDIVFLISVTAGVLLLWRSSRVTATGFYSWRKK